VNISVLCTNSNLPHPNHFNSANHPLIILSLNCQSLPAKKESFSNLINTHSTDIIFGSESWLKDVIYSNELFPTDYTVYHPDGYGGVFVACWESYASYRLDLADCSCELVVCEIKLADNTSLIVCSVYRPPSTDEYYLQKFCSELDATISSHPSSTIWIAGDVNLPDINWSSHCVTGHNYSLSLNNIFLNFLESNGLTRTVEFPTRGQNILDIFTNRPSLIVLCKTIDGISDQEVVLVKSDTTVNLADPPARSVYLWSLTDFDNIRHTI